MALNSLSLTGSTGIVGAPFSAAILGLTPGASLEVLADSSPGIGVANGRVTFRSLPYESCNVALRETLVGTGYRDTRMPIAGKGGQGRTTGLVASASDFSASLPANALIAALNDPYAGSANNIVSGPTVFSIVGASPSQLALVGAGVFPGVVGGIVVGGTAAAAGTSYTVTIRATSGDGKRTVSETLTFVALP